MVLLCPSSDQKHYQPSENNHDNSRHATLRKQKQHECVGDLVVQHDSSVHGLRALFVVACRLHHVLGATHQCQVHQLILKTMFLKQEQYDGECIQHTLQIFI